MVLSARKRVRGTRPVYFVAAVTLSFPRPCSLRRGLCWWASAVALFPDGCPRGAADVSGPRRRPVRSAGDGVPPGGRQTFVSGAMDLVAVLRSGRMYGVGLLRERRKVLVWMSEP